MIQNKYSKNILIIASFVIFAIFDVVIIWNHSILDGNDLYFHIERLEDLAHSNSIFPQFAFNSFRHNGSAVMTMYPYLILYPFAIIIHIIGHSTFVIYFMFIINAFTAFLISYFSSIKINRKLTSYIFALMYTLSYEFISLNFWSCDIGMSWSATFMPLIVFGFIYWLKDCKWIMLSIGMSLLIFSNIAVSFFTPVLLLLFILYNYKLICKKKYIISLIKAVVLTMLTTSVFWMPAIKLFIMNKFTGVGTTYGPIISTNIVKSLAATVIIPLSFLYHFAFPWELTIYSLIGLIIGIVYFKQLSHLFKKLYLFSVFILILASCSFIWNSHIMEHFGGIIQATIRMYLIPQVLLTYIFAIFISCKIQKLNLRKIIIFVSIVLLIQGGYSIVFHLEQNDNKIQAITPFKYKKLESIPLAHTDYYLGSNKSIHNLLKNDGYIFDKHDNKHIINFSCENNGYFHLKNNINIKKLILPCLQYKGTKYVCYINGEQVKMPHKYHHLILINHKIHKGYNSIRINPLPNKFSIYGRIISSMSILLYIYLILKRYLLNKVR